LAILILAAKKACAGRRIHIHMFGSECVELSSLLWH